METKPPDHKEIGNDAKRAHDNICCQDVLSLFSRIKNRLEEAPYILKK